MYSKFAEFDAKLESRFAAQNAKLAALENQLAAQSDKLADHDRRITVFSNFSCISEFIQYFI